MEVLLLKKKGKETSVKKISRLYRGPGKAGLQPEI
jgi:hypothetical protein